MLPLAQIMISKPFSSNKSDLEQRIGTGDVEVGYDYIKVQASFQIGTDCIIAPSPGDSRTGHSFACQKTSI